MGRKWNNIKEKKAAKDKDASRINAKFGREIYVAAKSGEPDPESNGALKIVLERAKTYSVPKHIIDRASTKRKVMWMKYSTNYATKVSVQTVQW